MTDRLYYRTHGTGPDKAPVPYGVCGICGRYALSTDAEPLPQHDGPAHEVWAYETLGLKAVRFECKDVVEDWATYPETMPVDLYSAACEICGNFHAPADEPESAHGLEDLGVFNLYQ